jgi:hypothetical protein
MRDPGVLVYTTIRQLLQNTGKSHFFVYTQANNYCYLPGENWGKITSPIYTTQHTTTQHNNQTLVAEYAKRYIFV